MSETLNQILSNHTCLFGSFDRGFDAAHGRGNLTPTINSELVRWEADAGRFGGCLVFDAGGNGFTEDEFLFAARDNFPYSESPFDGTVSLWLNGDPDTQLPDEHPVDPFHISRHAADGSFYLDLTRPNDWRYGSPRKLRYGMYGDSPAQDMFVGGQLIVASDLGWNDGNWHHVAATWKNANSENASAYLYVDGVPRGWLDSFAHKLRWNIDNLTIGLGQRYVGRIDELLILDAALSGVQIQELFDRTESLEGSL